MPKPLAIILTVFAAILLLMGIQAKTEKPINELCTCPACSSNYFEDAQAAMNED